jgi:hypothetical protein
MHRRHARITLACSGDQKKTGEFFGLCELSDAEILDLYENRVELTQDDIEFADYVWQLYCSDNPIRLENVSGFDEYRFEYLESAIELHLKRFPTIKNGLNDIENKIIAVASKEKLESESNFISSMLRNQGSYGFGDSQFQRMLQILRPLFKSYKPVRLNSKGLKIFNFETSFYPELRDNETYLGGALKYNFLLNTNSGRILKL